MKLNSNFLKKIAPSVCYVVGLYYGYLFVLEALKYIDLRGNFIDNLSLINNLHDHRDMFIAAFALYLGITFPKLTTANQTRVQRIHTLTAYLLRGVAIALIVMAVIVSGILGDDGGFGVFFIFPTIFAIALYSLSKFIKVSGDNTMLPKVGENNTAPPKKKHLFWPLIGLLVAIALFYFFISVFKDFG